MFNLKYTNILYYDYFFKSKTLFYKNYLFIFKYFIFTVVYNVFHTYDIVIIMN